MQKKRLDRFAGHSHTEWKSRMRIDDLSTALDRPAFRPSGWGLERTVSEYSLAVKEETRAAKARLRELPRGGHPGFLERECAREHLDFLATHARIALEISGSKSPWKVVLATRRARKRPPGGVSGEDTLRTTVMYMFSHESHGSPEGNIHVERRLDAPDIPVLIFNDLPASRAELERLVRPSIGGRKLRIEEFGEAAHSLMERLDELDPGLVILPTRGSAPFHGLLPSRLRGRAFVFDISEHRGPDQRLAAISRLLEHFKATLPSRIAWLDDKVLAGMQSGGTHDLLKRYAPGADYHVLALAAEQTPWRRDAKYHFAVKPRGDGESIPMLASAWLRLLAKRERENGNAKGAERLLGFIERKQAKHGVSGAP